MLAQRVAKDVKHFLHGLPEVYPAFQFRTITRREPGIDVRVEENIALDR